MQRNLAVKSKLCLFCASGIVEDDDNLKSQFSDFVKGVSVLCQVLKIESNLTLEENWDLGGNFLPSLVCCCKCGILLEKLVSLNQLMVQTQTRLEQNVRKLEHYVVKSTRPGAEVEYSLRACLELREEIIRSYEKGLEFIVPEPKCDQISNADEDFFGEEQEDEDDFFASGQDNIDHLNISKGDLGHMPQLESHPSQIDDGVRKCFVNLQRISSPSSSKIEDPKSNSTPMKRKRGRPRKYQEGEPRPKRIRKKKPKKERKSRLSDECLDDTFSSRGLRSRKCADKIESFREIEDEVGTSDDGDEEYRPERSRSSSFCGSIQEDLEESNQLPPEKAKNKPPPQQQKRRGPGRPPKPLEYRALKLKGRPRHLGYNPVKPFYLINKKSEIYMLANVKIQREAFTLFCKHPGCDFSAGGMEYFRDQDAFGKMREHIKNIHRKTRLSSSKMRGELSPNSKFFCWICDNDSFATKNELDNHFKSEHKNPGQIFTVCEICGWSSHRVNRIASHRESHLNKEEESRMLKLLQEKKINKEILPHIDPRTKNPGYNFRSIYVVNEALGRFMFLNVKLQRNDDNQLFCKFPDCNFSSGKMEYFSDQEVLGKMKEHIRRVHRNITFVASTPYYCWRCDKYLSNAKSYRTHLKEHKSDKATLMALCDTCGDTMIQANMAKHRTSHQNLEEQSANPLPRSKYAIGDAFPCEKCSKIYKNYKSYYKHSLTHLPPEERYRFQCEICGTKSLTSNSLNLHKRLVHFKETAEVKYVCPICDKKFVSGEKYSFDYHVRSHTGEKPYLCSDCGKGFRSKSNLTEHRRVHHSGEVACEFCPKMTNPKNLRLHQLTHHRDLMDVTQLSFRRKGQRGRQAAVENRPDFIGPILAFPCEPCGRVYKFKSKFVDHMKFKHKLSLPRNSDYPSGNLNDHKSEGFY